MVNLEDIKKVLDTSRLKDADIKTKILFKMHTFHNQLQNLLNDNRRGIPMNAWYELTGELQDDVDYLKDIIEKYKMETEFLLKEDLFKINKLYQKYK